MSISTWKKTEKKKEVKKIPQRCSKIVISSRQAACRTSCNYAAINHGYKVNMINAEEDEHRLKNNLKIGDLNCINHWAY